MIIILSPILYSDGKYSMIPIKSYLLLDIRKTKKVYPIANIEKYTHTWFIVPNNEYTCFEIEEHNRKFKIYVKSSNEFCDDKLIMLIKGLYFIGIMIILLLIVMLIKINTFGI